LPVSIGNDPAVATAQGGHDQVIPSGRCCR
jgi:hypothetical protein